MRIHYAAIQQREGMPYLQKLAISVVKYVDIKTYRNRGIDSIRFIHNTENELKKLNNNEIPDDVEALYENEAVKDYIYH